MAKKMLAELCVDEEELAASVKTFWTDQLFVDTRGP